MHAWAKTPSKIYSLIDSTRDYSNSEDKGATPDDLREAVTSLEEVERTARRVFGPAHPLTKGIDLSLRNARAALRARETAELP